MLLASASVGRQSLTSAREKPSPVRQVGYAAKFPTNEETVVRPTTNVTGQLPPPIVTSPAETITEYKVR